jgi:hypothetical protein
MKPITYWVQNDAINELVGEYGAQLEKLAPYTRRDLIACLANDAHFWVGESDDIDEVWPRIEHLTRHEKDLLIEAIAASLNVNPQKTGIPIP